MIQQVLHNNSTEIEKHTLSIQVSLNGLSFCVANSDGQIILLEEDHFGIQLSPKLVLDKIKYTFEHHAKLKQDFSKIEVLYQNDLYTIVPKALFDPSLLKEYLQYNIKVLSNDFIAYDELEQHNIVTTYIPYANINNYFFETFGAFTYKHTVTVLIDKILTKEKHADTTCIYAHMYPSSFDLVVLQKGKLLLCNSYNYENSEDFMYYLMFTAEQLNLNPEEFLLFFIGTIDRESSCFTLARKYIRHVDLGSITRDIELSETIETRALHKNFVLLSQF